MSRQKRAPLIDLSMKSKKAVIAALSCGDADDVSLSLDELVMLLKNV